MAAPTNSARSVATAMASAWTQSPKVTGFDMVSRHSSGRFRSEAMPIFADRYCTSMAIRFAATITHASR